MRRRRRGGHHNTFTEKTHSVRGIAAIILAVLSLAFCVCLIWYSYSIRGKASVYIACAGFLGFFASLTSFVCAVSSVCEPETFRVAPYTSLGISSVSLAVWIILYLGGI